jgi:hypothetical protein
MSKKLKINTCHECKYGDVGMEDEATKQVDWCHECSRELNDMTIIPHWCPLHDWRIGKD